MGHSERYYAAWWLVFYLLVLPAFLVLVLHAWGILRDGPSKWRRRGE